MSFNRRKFTALSSLAQQWSAEDEEEQERERRRRHRQLSSTSEAKEETPGPKQSAVSRAPNRFRNRNSPEVKLPKPASSVLAKEKKLVETLNKEEDKRTRRKVETLNNVIQDKATTNALKLEAGEEKAKSHAEPAQEQKDPALEKCQDLSQQKAPVAEKPQNLGQEKGEPTVDKHENLAQEEKNPQMGDDRVFDLEQKALDAQVSQEPVAVQNEAAIQQPQRASWERKSISRLEVKINSRVRNSSEAAPAAPVSGPQATRRSIPKIDEAKSSPTGQGGSEPSPLASQPGVTYSSSFKRISPRTISFRVVSRNDKQEDALSRSASMRLPASSTKLEEKLERYTSAVQRAGSIRLPPSARRNFQPPAEGVASKRSIFEANVSIRTEPTTPIRKESLKIPGGVSSRINLWISRTQEPSKDEGTKDSQRTENTVQRSQWGKRSSDS